MQLVRRTGCVEQGLNVLRARHAKLHDFDDIIKHLSDIYMN
jgi:hypothetical protein